MSGECGTPPLLPQTKVVGGKNAPLVMAMAGKKLNINNLMTKLMIINDSVYFTYIYRYLFGGHPSLGSLVHTDVEVPSSITSGSRLLVTV